MVEIKPDIEAVLQAEGIELRQRGRSVWGLCPFHADKHPSMKINVEKQRYKCWGCGEGGDVIDFIQKFHNLSFKDALKYLGMKPGKPPKVDPVMKRKRELLKGFERWRREQYRDLCDEYNLLWHTLRGQTTMEGICQFSEEISEMGLMEGQIELLFQEGREK